MPENERMSPKKGPFQKEMASSNHHFSGDMWVFRGVTGPKSPNSSHRKYIDSFSSWSYQSWSKLPLASTVKIWPYLEGGFHRLTYWDVVLKKWLNMPLTTRVFWRNHAGWWFCRIFLKHETILLHSRQLTCRLKNNGWRQSFPLIWPLFRAPLFIFWGVTWSISW